MEDKRMELVESLKKWLCKYKIKIDKQDENELMEYGIVCRLKKARHSRRVVLCVCDKDEEDNTYAYVTPKHIKPVFIREGDTLNFVKTKIINAFSCYVKSDFNEDIGLNDKGKAKKQQIKDLKKAKEARLLAKKEERRRRRKERREMLKLEARKKKLEMELKKIHSQQPQYQPTRPKRQRIHITRPAAQLPPQPTAQPQAEPVKHKRPRIHITPSYHVEKVESIRKNRDNDKN